MNHYQNGNPSPAPKNNPIPAADSSPYPKISITKQNPRYVQMLISGFSSPHGELTAIQQYLCQSWVFEKSQKELSQIFKRIAMVEMHHFDLLGQMICALGGTPKLQYFKQNHPIPWNGNMLLYNQNIKQILQHNIVAEQGAIQFYLKSSRTIGDECISKILYRIALDEQLHLEILKDYLNKFI